MPDENKTRDDRGGRRRQAQSTPLRTRTPIANVRARKRPRKGWQKWLRIGLVVVVAGGLLGVGGLAGVFVYFSRDLPDVQTLRDYRPPQTTRVLDRDGEEIGEIFDERRTVIPMDRIPRAMVLSTLAAEDADFYRHEGLSYRGILRAVLRDVIAGRAAQGASTITQQVVKLMLLSPERTISRKIRELILARRLEQELSKDEILWLYLNHINYGRGRYGVQEAAQFYFGKDAADLTLAEASLIAGVPQSPARLSPRRHPEAARRRQLYVLGQLEAKQADYWPDLPLEDIAAAREATPTVIPAPEASRLAPEYLTIARSTLREVVGEEAYRQGGYTIHTTVDSELQEAARTAVQTGLQNNDDRHGNQVPFILPSRRRLRRMGPLEDVETLRLGRTYDAEVTGYSEEHAWLELDVGGHPAYVRYDDLDRFNTDDAPLSEVAQVGARVRVSILAIGEPPAEGELTEEGEAAPAERSRAQFEVGPQAAALVIDPRTRDVLAMIGGYEASSGFNRALQALRQPGSTFKPLVYLQGLRSRSFTPASLVVDAPAVYDQWRPDNYEAWHEGPVRLRMALAKSINLVAVRVMEEVGPENVVQLARSMGIESELDPSLSLALGASGVRPIEMVNAYATLAAGGRWEAPRFITRIVGPDGADVPLPPRPPARDVVTPAEAYLITSMMTSVVAEGTARRAQRLGRPVAGKTGTSNEARDAWFMGFSPDMVAGVWVGRDDSRPLGRRESGGRSALPIWIDVMRAATAGRPEVDFPMPSGIVTATIDPETGLLAYEGMEGGIEEVFLDGTAPVETARPPDVADPNQFLMEQFGQFGAEPEPDRPAVPIPVPPPPTPEEIEAMRNPDAL